MSAFVIDSATMGRVLRGLFARNRWGQIIARFDGEFTAPGDQLSADPTMVGRKLFAMNVEAVTQRYPDCRSDPGNLPGPHCADILETEYRSPITAGKIYDRPALVDFYKAIRCLLYQCSEGNVPESPLYQELQRAAGELAEGIVRMLPEYEKAGW